MVGISVSFGHWNFDHHLDIGAWNLVLVSLSSCHRREDAYDISLFENLIGFPVDAIDQNNLRDLFGYPEPFQDILHPGLPLDLHIAREAAAPFGKIIPERRKKFDFNPHHVLPLRMVRLDLMGMPYPIHHYTLFPGRQPAFA